MTPLCHLAFRSSKAGMFRLVTLFCLVLVSIAPDGFAQSPGQLIRPGDFPTGLKGWWKLDEASGARMDASGNGNHLTSQNNAGSANEDYWATGESSADLELDNSQYLSITDASQTGLDLAGSYTIALWFKCESMGNPSRILTKTNPTQSDGYNLYIHAGGAVLGHAAAGASLSYTWSLNKWYHLAVVFDSGTNKANFYVDGDLQDSQDLATALTDSADPFIVGSFRGIADFFDGRMKDLAVWNSILTPLQVKSLAFGVDLANRAYRPGDVSTPPTAWWKMNEVSNGSGSVTRADSAGGHTLLDTTNTFSRGGYLEGAAARFAGDDFMEAADHADWDVGTGDFSCSFWTYLNTTTGQPCFLANGPTSAGIALSYYDTTKELYCYLAGNVRAFAWSPMQNTWYHVVLRRQGGQLSAFVDGLQIGNTLTSAEDITGLSSGLRLGRDPGNLLNYLNGRLSDVAFWKGYALSAAEIKALATAMPVQKAGIVSYWPMDEKVGKVATAVGNAQSSVAVQKFGSGSLVLDGSGDYLTLPDSPDWDFDSGDYTIDFWARFNSLSGDQYFFNRGNNELAIRRSDGSLQLVQNQGILMSRSWSPTTGQWYHIEASREAGEVRLFIDGVQQGASLTDSTSLRFASEVRLGVNGSGTDPLNGWIDEFRLTKGVARHSVNFTPPASAHPVDEPTVLLLHFDGDLADASGGASGTREDQVGVNDLTPVNATGSGIGLIGNAAHLERDISQYLQVTGTPVDLNLPASFSLIAWVKREDTSTHTIFDKNGFNNTGYTLALESAALQGEFFPAGNSGVKSNSSVGAGEWTHLAATYDQAFATVYFNSVRETGVAHAIDATDTTTSLRIGSRTTDQYYFDGMIDEAIIARRWLRKDEIKALYLRGLVEVPAFSWLAAQVTGGPVMEDGSGIVSFPDQTVETNSAPVTVTITNTTAETLDDLAAVLTGPHWGEFSLDTAGMSTSLAPGASTSFTVVFSPLAFSARSAVVEVTSSSPGTSNAFDFTVSGTGQADVPSITALSSHNAKPGDSITITGSGFSAVPANNAVWFSATKGTVTSASTTQLTVEVPAGATSGLLSVSVHGYVAFSRRVFTPSFDGPGLALDVMDFSEAGRFAVGSGPLGNFIADVDVDGYPDLLSANGTGNSISVLRNTTGTVGDLPTFSTKTDFAATGNPEGIVSVEITGDGKPDLLASGELSGEVHVLRNDSTSGSITSGSFTALPPATGGTYPQRPVSCDVDGDGLPDLITAMAQGSSVGIHRQITPGVFGSRFLVSTDSSDARRIVVADFNADGKTDLAVSHASGDVVMLRNTSTPGTIQFTKDPVLSVSASCFALVAADLDGDGRDDLIAGMYSSSNVRVWRNTSSGAAISFDTPIDLAVEGGVYSLAVGDLNGDGRADIAAAHGASAGKVSLIPNIHTGGALSGGSFGTRTFLNTGGTPQHVSIGDLNGDQTPEILVTMSGTNELAVWRSAYVPTPTIGSLSVNAGEPGSSIVITGTNFNTTPGDNIVWFGSVRGVVTAATGTQLTVTVPHGAMLGPITVQVNGRSSQSTEAFTPSFQSGGDLVAGSFSATTSIDGPGAANGSVVSDFDGDGRPDLAVGSYTGHTVTVYLNALTPGSLAPDADFPANALATPGTTLSANPYVQRVAAGDLDGDGKQDLITAHNTVSYVSVLRNTSTVGNASFATRETFSVGGTPLGIDVVDLNQDGRPEIVVATSAGVSVIRNTGSPGVIGAGSFATSLDLDMGGGCRDVSVRDLNGDGRPDIAATQLSGNLVVKENLSDPYEALATGSFGANATFTAASGTDAMAIADLDLDGHMDVITENYTAPSVSIFHNAGSGAMATRLTKVTDKSIAGGAGSGIRTGDLNGDGKPDFVRAPGSSSFWEVFQNNSSPGSVAVADALTVSTPFSAYGANVVDFDADGRPDIIGYSYDGSKLLLTRNIHVLGTPQISVEYPVSTPLTDGTGVVNCGGATVGQSSGDITVTIRNTGTANLENLALSLSGVQMAEFSLGTLPGTTLAPGASLTFTITLSPSALGTRTAGLQIASNVDGAENPFDLILTGAGINGTLNTNFTSGGTTGLASDGFIATGSTANLTLGYAPMQGTLLTLVDNTSADPITGTFTNLAQGQTVTLSFGGADYRFFADYFGGDGNDLVLILQGPGILDLSFGGTGKVETPIGSEADESLDVVIQPDGRIVAVGWSENGGKRDIAVARYNTDGTIDLTFGNNGKVTTSLGGGDDEAYGVALQADGKIVVAGTSTSAFALVRYHTNGAVDTSFNGTGSVVTDISPGSDKIRSVALQSDGKILVAGESFSGIQRNFTLARYNNNGSLDTNFNGSGIVTTDFGSDDLAFSLALQADGKIVAAGMTGSSGTNRFAVARYNANGTLDPSFNGTGTAITIVGTNNDDIARSVVVQRDGKIVVGGHSSSGSYNFAVVRYNSDGTLDPSFNSTGKVINSLAVGLDEATRVMLQCDEKIVLAGHANRAGSGLDFALIRYNRNGTLDTSFHGTGVALESLSNGSDYLYGAAIQCDGNIVASGVFNFGSSSDFGLIRCLGDADHVVTFTSATDVPLSFRGLHATGRNLSVELDFDPTPGTRLTVFDNTGLHPILGEFANLAHGQEILLSHGGNDYPFVANYFGGDGNDLALEWKYNRLLSWGTNTSGALGVAGSPAFADTATQVVATAAVEGGTVLSTASGRDFSLAVLADGTVAAWGENGEGQLGNNSFVDASTPVPVWMGGVLNGKKVVAVSAGWKHSLALCSDGTVAAWGDNAYGQLGDNTTIDKKVPVLVESAGALNGKRVTAIAAGSTHSVALCSDGTVVCWGDNDSRQLGNGGTSRSSVPVAVVTGGILNGKAVKAIATGSGHTLALLTDGTVVAWGANALKQLGNASTSNSNVPVAVNTSGVLDGKTVTAIAAGGSSSYALCADGTLVAWGNNDHGQIGNNVVGGSYGVPETVDTSGALNGKTISQLQAGFRHAAAVCTDGTAVSWGWNQDGQLGNDSNIDSGVPVAVTDSMLGTEERFSEVSGGADTDHVVAIVATGPPAPLIQVEDSLGNPLSDNGAENFGSTLVSTTKIRTYTIRNTGTAAMSGIAASLFGTWQGDYAILAAPAPTLAPGDATSLTLAFTPSSAVPKGATLRINSNVTANDLDPFDIALSGSGSNSISLSYSTGTEVPATTMVAPFSAAGKTINLNPATALNYVPPSGSTLMVLDNRTTEFVSGSFNGLTHGQTVSLDYEGATYPFVVSYFGGDGNDVVLLWAGTRLLAWGPNGSGTLGNGSTVGALSPTPVTTGGVLSNKTLVSVVAGERHTLALCADGTLAAWGANDVGQLGTGNGTPSLVPVLVSSGPGSALDGKTVIAIAAGLDFSVALCSDGTVATWGVNSAGQLGTGGAPGGFSDLPVAVTGGAISGRTPAGIAAGVDFVIVRCTDGSALSWGANGAGQLGDGTILDRTAPVVVDTSGVLDGHFVKSVAAGHFHALALCTDGSLVAWGDNTFGELGDGTTNGSSFPVAVSVGGVLSGKIPVGISAGQFHCFALCSDGTLSSWGLNSEGQLGKTGPAQSSLPLDITSSGVLVGRTVTSVVCGQGNGVAVLADGSIASWGANQSGQVGDGSNLQRGTPVAIGQGTLVAGERVRRVGSGPNASNGYAIVATAVVPPSGTPVLSTDDATSITKTGALLNGVINPNGSNSSVYFEIGTDVAYGMPPTAAQVFTGTADAPVSQSITGLEPNTTYFVRLAASYNGGLNFAYGDGKAFTTAPDPPSASAGPASNIGTNGVTLNGTVNPNGRDTTAKFQVSTDGNFNSILEEFEVDGVAAGASLVSRSRTITGLVHATTYYYRLIAQNSAGSQLPGEANVVSFTTSNLPPVATTGGYLPVTGNPTRIVVGGSVRASDADTTVTFLYGPVDGGFPNSITATPGVVTGDVDTPVSAELSNLQQGKTYHYKVRAENSGGAVEGSVQEFDIEAISGLDRVSPGTRPASDGFLTVNLNPPGLAHGWRFFGEQEWRISGFPALGFPTGNREIEYRPVPGWINPPSEIVSIISGVATPVLERSYFEAGGGGTGSLKVTLVPESLTSGPERAQWRLLGEDGSAWRDSETTVSGLFPGNYLVECKPVAGRSTPPNTSVPVVEGQTAAPTIVYQLPDAATGETPVALGFETVTAGGDLPYGFVGQIRSRSGSGTGFVVKPRVVATAAHVVWDDTTHAATEGLQWMHQRHRGTYEPKAIEPRGFYVFDGYAAQRIADNSPGDSSPQSQHLDVAAIYFNESAARGGSGGFLASDLDDNEFLLSHANKVLVGYPVDGIDPGIRGRMHATPPLDIDFDRGFGRTFTTSDVGSFGGNSGGPLCVQYEGGAYYPAAVYLGGNAQTVVRAIDSEVVDLFNRAETSGNGGNNNTGGGITHTDVTTIGGVDSPGSLQINLEPAAAVSAGAGWRLRPESTFRSSGATVGNLKAARYRVELATVDGFQAPSDLVIRVKGGQARSITFTYAPPVVQNAGISVRGNGRNIDNGDTSPSILDHSDFGLVEVDSGSRARTFTVQNSGNAPLSLGSVLIDGAHPDDFSVLIPPGTSIPAGGTTTFTILFEPSAPGTRSASVSFATNVALSNPFEFTIQGNDTTDSDADGFTDVEEAALAELLEQFAVGESVDLDLSFLQLTAGQIVELLNLPPGLNFDPGTNRITGTITGKAASSQIEVRKRDGATIVASIAVDFPVFVPASVEVTGLRPFSTTRIRRRSRPQIPKITNTGELALNGLKLNVTGKAARDFIVTQPAEKTLDAGSSTTFTITFKPRSKGTRSASITVFSSADPRTVPATGKGKQVRRK